MKTIVITGVTSGIGKALVRYFLNKGERVIGISRSDDKLSALQKDFESVGLKNFHPVKADFSVLKEVEDAGKKILEFVPKGIDVLIHNAAIIPQKKEMTVDSHEMQFQVNYLAAVKLTHSLLPLLTLKKGIVITTSSRIHTTARFILSDLEAIKHYFLLKSYARTKLYNILFARGINEHIYPNTGVFAYTIDPGLVKTDIMEKYSSGFFRWAFRSFTSRGIMPEIIGDNYGYLVYNHPIDGNYSFSVKSKKHISRTARNDKYRDQLWEETEKILSISFP